VKSERRSVTNRKPVTRPIRPNPPGARALSGRASRTCAVQELLPRRLLARVLSETCS
jgi:hypothetical protein